MRNGILSGGGSQYLSPLELKEIEKEISGAVAEVKRTASQVDKLRMKLNLVSRDIRPIIQSLENNQYKQGTALLDVSNEVNFKCDFRYIIILNLDEED